MNQNQQINFVPVISFLRDLIGKFKQNPQALVSLRNVLGAAIERIDEILDANDDR